jgi:hypothetical protein
MRAILTIGNTSLLTPEDFNLEDLVKLAEGSIIVDQGYSRTAKWKRVVKEANIDIKIIGESAIEMDPPEEGE